jgi:hypothetical protein
MALQLGKWAPQGLVDAVEENNGAIVVNMVRFKQRVEFEAFAKWLLSKHGFHAEPEYPANVDVKYPEWWGTKIPIQWTVAYDHACLRALDACKKLSLCLEEGNDEQQGTHYVRKDPVTHTDRILAKGSFIALVEEARQIDGIITG